MAISLRKEKKKCQILTLRAVLSSCHTSAERVATILKSILPVGNKTMSSFTILKAFHSQAGFSRLLVCSFLKRGIDSCVVCIRAGKKNDLL